jgi:ABC-type lipoprotein export system ATPase subunit
MSLLELRSVSKLRAAAGRRVAVLANASLAIDPGELVAVWGLRGSGRTTLLRVAAGIDRPEQGSVWFAGRDLAEHSEDILGREIAYCQKSFRTAQGQTAVNEVMVGLLVNGAAPAEARLGANEALERVGGTTLGACRISDLDSGERTRVAVAHALALHPTLLVIDEPVAGVELRERDGILSLLRSLADDGVAVLMTVGDLTGLTGADQSLTIGDGELRGSGKRQLEPIADLSLRRQATR